jgi:RNA polymerase sigma factor (TIGR02999 family)
MGTAHPDYQIALLGEVRAGAPSAQARLVGTIYSELRRIAGGLMRRERPDHTLQPSALVHEGLFQLLSGLTLVAAPDRRYLFTAIAQAVRRVLVDHTRGRGASKRPGSSTRIPLDVDLTAFDEKNVDVVALHESLERLARAHPRQAQVVELRFFGGLSVPEIADTLGVSDTTVESNWRFARAWLRGQLGGTPA